ncbi:MAG: hypothetical protein CMP32_02905 [Rickettsiales bacterium]|nr:hypothetical protein [Rickettsiales bacterium]|tara:strand:- start:1173 stop:1448 length:276 start_codon:yes stop_codon:yes gene_type:complete
MENEIDSMIELLNEVSKTDDAEKIANLEIKIKTLSQNIVSNLSKAKEDKLTFSQDKLSKLSKLIEIISDNNEKRQKTFLDFKKFLENRKIN